jgi:hypothetical protein
MTRSDPDPVPGDFDDELESLDPHDVQIVEPSHEGRLIMQVTLEGEDVDELQRIADARGEKPEEVVSALIRAASTDGGSQGSGTPAA